ncbi:MAG: phosphoenolpyruvate synthase [Gammaproteobacteria bacterium]|nr:phosphoenolpyruvate synthase [Gammaproteobacteria bacterium]MCW8992053.1 phosphoenolpyruvate synthase [Gammaproteobacteria bacterium]
MELIKRFVELGIKDVPLVGGKNASLGEMYRELKGEGIEVPNGFATTAEAYRQYIEHNNLHERIAQELETLDTSDTRALAISGARIRQWIMHGTMPQQLVDEIREAYKELEAEYGDNTDVAVRSSATAEDLPNASFAGQQETYLNIRGTKNLLATCKQVFASLFTDRAISYRVHQGFDHMDVALSIGVQQMVRADLGASGVMFSIDTETGFRDVVFITAAYGLGETVVQGSVNPDEFYVFKPTLAEGKRPILKRQLGEKAIKMIYTSDPMAGMSTHTVRVSRDEQRKFAINDEEVLQLARYAATIEKHYDRPMDIEWAKDGNNGKLYILQARPETVQAGLDATMHEVFRLKSRGKVLATGKSVGQRIATGKARVILESSQMHELQPGEVLITDMTDPDWEPVMKVASAIVTNRGGRTCHAAIIARELGIPAVVGTGDTTQTVNTGQMVTVSCAEGDTGLVYEGEQEFEVEKVDLSRLGKPKTKIMLNLGNPELAFEASRLPTDGVGLARLEFIINNAIRVHPRALLEYDKLDAPTQTKVDDIAAGYPGRREYYINRLAEGVGTIAAAFYPRPVIVRMSDFKSNEYAQLVGGEQFEPKEENPMIGFRGAYRYPSADFAESFSLECQAMKQVREEMGLDNVALMVPFVRSVEEGERVLQLMAQNGLSRGENGLEIYVMCEIPANALLADQFLEHFDGFSIGSNDLTQLTLGVDRDSGLVTGVDERNPAVLQLMEMAIDACKRHNKYIGICGQAPSDFPEITEWLVEKGIGSISLNPDSILRMTEVVLEMEKKRQ